ncbi:MAG: STAS domain-containing protein [Syntrophobacterales bacterium]|nr:STAS domain-containing protein [Syntrophobacterales bacterium]
MCSVEINRAGDDGDRLDMSLRGKLVRGEVKAVMERMLREIHSSSNLKHVTVNISSLEWIDTAGVALLVLFCQRIRAMGGTFRLVKPNEKVLKVFKLAQVEGFLSIEDGNDRA